MMNMRMRDGAAPLILSLLVLQIVGCAQPQKSAQHVQSACSSRQVAGQPERLFLQQIGPSSALVRWRGGNADAVCFGMRADALDMRVEAHDEGGHREALLTGLQPDTVYHYALGSVSTAPEGQRFRTAPKRSELPADGNTRILLLGDSGTARNEIAAGKPRKQTTARAVIEGVQHFIAREGRGEPIDMLLALGDNAYTEGTDVQWQQSFFETYPEMLRQVATWPTIGNHEMGQAPLDICVFVELEQCSKGPVIHSVGGASESADPDSYDSDGDGPDPGGMPYLSIFNLPVRGELGGVASDTEQYYSFDHANLHIVSLDAQLSNRDPVQRATMREWLVRDLAANDSDWTIVIFHLPPYSRGVHHDSDREQAEVDMRETFVPVFEQYGVDVVYSGHSHSYERSWYLRSHHGPAASFDPALHAALNAVGEPASGQGDEAYRKARRGDPEGRRVVYTVAGSAGQADRERPCEPGQHLMCTDDAWLTHPAHRSFGTGPDGYRPHGIARVGAVVLDADRDSLTSRFVDQHGEVLDWFVIRR